jgi:hypothetical protein
MVFDGIENMFMDKGLKLLKGDAQIVNLDFVFRSIFIKII